MIVLNEPVVTAGLPLNEAKKVLIMLHGRGDRANSFIRLATELEVPDFACLAPQAIRNTWYPHSFLMPLSQNEPQLSLSLSGVHEVVDNLTGLGFDAPQIYFLGFSQGACLSLEYTARYARRYGGVVAFTGGLLGDTVDVSNYTGDFAGTPIFIGSSDHDPHVPEARIDESEVILRQMGAEVTKKIYPGLGHTINEDELRRASTILNAS
ncbi:MAG: dienelactone hydrolase family protein [Tunicatimonas sp.]